ncbi:MAG TPA: hypothetical protein DEF45_11635 [Rhodopirellula sp.]|nr:hypothetical protein [Rhodopirellula sp.]
MPRRKTAARGEKTFMKTPSCFEHMLGDEISPLFISRLDRRRHHESIKGWSGAPELVCFDCTVLHRMYASEYQLMNDSRFTVA